MAVHDSAMKQVWEESFAEQIASHLLSLREQRSTFIHQPHARRIVQHEDDRTILAEDHRLTLRQIKAEGKFVARPHPSVGTEFEDCGHLLHHQWRSANRSECRTIL